MKISVLTSSNNPLIKHFPNGKPVWGNCEFYFNEKFEDCDCLFVLDTLPFEIDSKCGKSNTFLCVCEPPFVKLYHPKYISQFGNLISFRKFAHYKNNFIDSFPLLPWLSGSKFIESKHSWNETNYISYDEFVKLSIKDKYNKIAIITSNKAFTRGHRKRLKFLAYLKNSLPDILDIFGDGFQFVEDKFDVYSKYKYVIAFENCSYSGYWTEKIADAFLCNCLPLYFGDPCLDRYFDVQSYIQLDLNEPEMMVQKIKQIIKEDTYSEKIKYIEIAKQKVMNEYNLFSVMAKISEKYHKCNDKSFVNLKVEHPDKFHKFKQVLYRLGK